MLHRFALAASLVASALLGSAPIAWAQSVQCSTCEDCTAALGVAGAQAQLAGDLALRGAGPCVVVRGEGARFDGQGHVMLARPGGGVGVRIEAAGAGLRNLRVAGADVGVHVASARDVTVYNVTAEARATGFKVERSANVRLDRVRSAGGRVGVSFGAADDGACPAALPMNSPGAVVLRSTIERATTGIAACDARPVLTGNTVTRNQVGVVLGAPAAAAGVGGAAPYDGCACAPGIDGMRPGAAAMFSSGCGGCQVHEGWMPSLRRRGADILVRESGPGTEEAQRRFDRYGWRCLPGLMDSLGIPGCVPNYACPSSGAFSKRRQNGGELAVDVPINSEDDALRFARECAGGAQGRYARGGSRCVLQAVTDNTICDNRALDLRAIGDAVRAGGARNRCGRVEAWTEGGQPGCAQGCDAAPEPPPLADLAPPALPQPAAPAPAPPPSARPSLAAPVPAPARAPGAPPSGNEPLYLVGALVAAALGGAWLFRKRA